MSIQLPGTGENVETADAPGTGKRQVVALAEMGGGLVPTVGKVEHTSTGIGHGKKTVAAAGTDEALAASTPAKWVIVQAYRANTAMVAVGGAGVDATAANGDGVTLAAGENITLAIDNLADVHVDATVSGEGVRFTYGT